MLPERVIISIYKQESTRGKSNIKLAAFVFNRFEN